MPQRGQPETAHTSLTNHRITRRPGEPWPDEAFKQTTPSLPDLVHVNRVPGRDEDIPQVSLLEAYREISERKPEYIASYRKLLDDLEQQGSGDATVQLALGRRDLEAGDAQRAIERFQHSAQLDPQNAAAFGYLSQALEERGRTTEAIAASEKAVSLNPYEPLLQKGLVKQ
jgi:tetratricopeptide (TPR) repeat protein